MNRSWRDTLLDQSSMWTEISYLDKYATKALFNILFSINYYIRCLGHGFSHRRIKKLTHVVLDITFSRLESSHVNVVTAASQQGQETGQLPVSSPDISQHQDFLTTLCFTSYLDEHCDMLNVGRAASVQLPTMPSNLRIANNSACDFCYGQFYWSYPTSEQYKSIEDYTSMLASII
ncbi:hypothetical protein BDB00DRAFT_873783 [Zychaea mexicana]|uniref:uncharacterized protein n=1 Tax=Zychaea mexicana TaxID=64656 RepID=UPI0022FEA56A|nr:uncharacterized protein BDB00DRAFT_873783 [Zychaea mexicana]KAI9491948.1 hypothetical protein BDB00DRAFT_873783 [Zychaea mexicana]